MRAMKRILIKAAYDGTSYHGWQRSENAMTIAGEIEKALKKLTGEDIQVNGTSRTDAGVHSEGNLAVFDTESSIPPERFCLALNTCLPDDIRIVGSKEVPPDYHPRFLKTAKTYLYRIHLGEFPDPLRDRYVWHLGYELDLKSMQEAAEYLKGEHDFKSFCSVHTETRTTVREIADLTVERIDDEIHITVRGYGFLYNMVRIIAGTLSEVGRGLRKPSDIREILLSMDRVNAGQTAPAKGLTLIDIRVIDEEGL